MLARQGVPVRGHQSGTVREHQSGTARVQLGTARVQLGQWGEQAAVDHVTGLGYTVLARNWRCRFGEIDIVCRDEAAGAVVFVEVKTRSGTAFGAPAEAVGHTKRRRLRLLAALWLREFAPKGTAEVRFDVVGILAAPGAAPVVDHLVGVL